MVSTLGPTLQGDTTTPNHMQTATTRASVMSISTHTKHHNSTLHFDYVFLVGYALSDLVYFSSQFSDTQSFLHSQAYTQRHCLPRRSVEKTRKSSGDQKQGRPAIILRNYFGGSLDGVRVFLVSRHGRWVGLRHCNGRQSCKHRPFSACCYDIVTNHPGSQLGLARTRLESQM